MGEKRDNIILIGFMGSGKTTVGICLSYKMKRTFSDMDKMIERREGMSVSEIFAVRGEDYFRERETALLRDLKKEHSGGIFSAGGGTPLRAENRKLLSALGTVVWLKVSAETVYQRLEDDTTRPLLQGADPMGKIKALLREREELYAAAADLAVTTDKKTVGQIAEEIAVLLKGGETI